MDEARIVREPCPRCGHREQIDGVRVLDYGHGNTARDLTAAVYQRPAALIFKGKVSSALTARVCAGCGYVEFYVRNPRELRDAVVADE
jgi:hypothetical protein